MPRLATSTDASRRGGDADLNALPSRRTSTSLREGWSDLDRRCHSPPGHRCATGSACHPDRKHHDPEAELLALSPQPAPATATLATGYRPIRRRLVNSVRQQFRDQRKQGIRAKAGAVDQRLHLVV
jgi:hypothetical protein